MIASTIRLRLAQNGSPSGPHAISVVPTERGRRVEVGSTPSGDSLFLLEWDSDGAVRLSSFQGERGNWTEMQLEAIVPDPLWDSADSICSHMEHDHADTFGLFLTLIGRDDLAQAEGVTMPWVQADGFYLTAGGSHHFVPFPQRCEDANSVRTTLVKMLRGARAANSTN